jgi:hypothetical protein
VVNVKTLQEAAHLFGLNEATLRSAANDKRVPASKSGGTWLLDIDDPAVQAYRERLKPRERGKEKPVCQICGKPVPRARAKYCDNTCYGKAMRS